jgi:hypothetical protein
VQSALETLVNILKEHEPSLWKAAGSMLLRYGFSDLYLCSDCKPLVHFWSLSSLGSFLCFISLLQWVYSCRALPGH